MKARYYLPIAIASLALASNTVRAQDSDLREHAVTISLQLSTEGEDEYDEDDNGYKASQKIEKVKISNKEILEALVEQGVISDAKGWKIVVLTEGNADIEGFFLVKKDETPIEISEFFDFDIFFAVEEYKEEENEKNNGDVKFSSKSGLVGTGALSVEIGDFLADTSCIVKIEGEESYKEDDDDFESENITNKASFESCVGEASEDDETFGVVEGDVKAGNGKKTDLGDD